MKKIFILILTFTFFSLFAQKKELNHNSHCGYDIALDLLEKKGKLQDYLENRDLLMQDFQANLKANQNKAINEIYQIPVVIHILWDDANGINLTDAQIATMMSNLNKDYSRTNDDVNITRPEFSVVASSVDIQFCLAQTDPDGKITTGVERFKTSHGWFNPAKAGGNAEDAKYTIKGGLDAWDTKRYLNIWICDLTQGTGNGTVGYSTLPGSHGDLNDGFLTDCVGISKKILDRTATHEIGHYFGLLHPWGPGATGDCAADDGFMDTPKTDSDHIGGACADAVINCGSNDQFENFMGYSNCTNMFTIEQAAFMKTIIEGTRSSLLNNDLCSAPILTADFTPDVLTQIMPGQTITFTSTSKGPKDITNWNWIFNGGTPATANTKGPHVITYNKEGTFSVSLTIGDGIDTDTKTNTDSVGVYLVLKIDSFIGIPTVINVGKKVNYKVYCNQPNSKIDSIRWFFEGADLLTYKQTYANSFNISYSTGGIFDVECRVYRNNGMDGDTLIKQDYITVISPENIPVANFVASKSNIEVGTTINFTNLTNIVNQLDSCRWLINDGLTIIESTDIHPTGITYNTIGDWNVQLLVYSPYGDHDTLKLGYIHVFSPLSPKSISVDFTVIGSRIITAGQSIQFQDLSKGDIQKWKYIFDRGVGDAYLEYEVTQNPIHPFATPGIYNVTLIASNSSFSDTLTKERYIVVSATPWDRTYCDTLSNILENESKLVFHKASSPSWGYFPGHYAKRTSMTSSEKKLKRYAERFETYTPDNIAAVLLPVEKAYSGDDDAIIRIQIWDADANGMPNNLLTGYADNKIRINKLEAGIYNYIELDNPVNVDSVFFVGFKLDYKTESSAQDTFVSRMVPSRALPKDNRIYVSRASSGGGWQTPTEFLEFELNSSIAIKVMGCLVNVPEIKELEASISIYPNPASDRIFIDLGDLRSENIQIEMFDIVGKKVNSDIIRDNYSNKFEINLDYCRNGFYLVNITIDGFQITKKVLVQK